MSRFCTAKQEEMESNCQLSPLDPGLKLESANYTQQNDVISAKAVKITFKVDTYKTVKLHIPLWATTV